MDRISFRGEVGGRDVSVGQVAGTKAWRWKAPGVSRTEMGDRVWVHVGQDWWEVRLGLGVEGLRIC